MDKKELFWIQGSKENPKGVKNAFERLGILTDNADFDEPDWIYYGCSGEPVAICIGDIDAKIIQTCGMEVKPLITPDELASQNGEDDNKKLITLEEQFAKTFNQTLTLIQEARKAGFFSVILTDGELRFIKYDDITNIGRIFDVTNGIYRNVICTSDHCTFKTDEPAHDIIMRMAEWCEMREKQE